MRTVRRTFFGLVDTYRVVRQWVRNNDIEVMLLVVAIFILMWMGISSAATTYVGMGVSVGDARISNKGAI